MSAVFYFIQINIWGELLMRIVLRGKHDHDTISEITEKSETGRKARRKPSGMTAAIIALAAVIACGMVWLPKTHCVSHPSVSRTDMLTEPSEAQTQGQTGPPRSLDELDSVSVGDHFTFGSYPQNTVEPEPIEWRVLDVQDGSALIISEYVLTPAAYNRDLTDVTWETCSLRKWLNGTFYDTAFSESEKSRIQNVKNKNPDNPLYGTDGGSDTEDRVFCLSLEEAQLYFKDSKERAAAPTAYAIKRGASTNDDITLDNGMKTGWWWLRSPASSADRAADVDSYGSIDIEAGSGENGVDGDYVFDETNCVRPVVTVSV